MASVLLFVMIDTGTEMAPRDMGVSVSAAPVVTLVGTNGWVAVDGPLVMDDRVSALPSVLFGGACDSWFSGSLWELVGMTRS